MLSGVTYKGASQLTQEMQPAKTQPTWTYVGPPKGGYPRTVHGDHAGDLLVPQKKAVFHTGSSVPHNHASVSGTTLTSKGGRAGDDDDDAGATVEQLVQATNELEAALASGNAASNEIYAYSMYLQREIAESVRLIPEDEGPMMRARQMVQTAFAMLENSR